MEWSFRTVTQPSVIEPPIEDDVVKGNWGHFVLQMSNKYYSPEKLAFRKAPYGDDLRIKYMVHFLDVRGQRVLEIGPCDGYLSVILEKMGVAELISVESREVNMVKCNRIKEKYHLNNTTFIQQDIERIYQGREPAKFSGSFDLVFCVGLLYHLPNPAEALEWIRGLAPTLFLATHIFEPNCDTYKYPEHRPGILEHKGRRYDGLIYGEHGLADPLSGMSPTSFWPKEEALVQMVKDAGYKEIHVLARDRLNSVPHVTILAKT